MLIFCFLVQQALTGLDDLRQVRTLEMRVDTRENSLGNFGAFIPNLKLIETEQQCVTSVRRDEYGHVTTYINVFFKSRLLR
uniref:Uncharacterized protein n=1 Tax=Sphaerodactylus townsendi TaxID=933632 RepID=A0ACB8G262_9SAUR